MPPRSKRKKRSAVPEGLSTSMLVDVLFILLIFFILVSSIKKDKLKVELAKVKKQLKKQATKRPKVEHQIGLDHNNKISLNDNSIGSYEQLTTSLTAIKQQTPKNTILIITLRPDAKSSSSKLLEIFAALGETGLSENVQCEVNSVN